MGRAVTAGVLTFTVVSSISFVTCANEHNRKYELLKKAFELQGIKDGRKTIGGSESGSSSSSRDSDSVFPPPSSQ